MLAIENKFAGVGITDDRRRSRPTGNLRVQEGRGERTGARANGLHRWKGEEVARQLVRRRAQRVAAGGGGARRRPASSQLCKKPAWLARASIARTDVHITFQPSEIDGAVSSACFLIVLNHVCLPRRSGANVEGAGMDAVDPEGEGDLRIID